jgi:hypothetical protein
METGNLMIDAQTAFARERRRSRRAKVARWLLRRPRECGRLMSLEQELGAAPPANRRSVGLREVRLDSIIGTAEATKARTFDHRFRPPSSSRRRWERLWIAGRRGEPLPPIAVFRLGRPPLRRRRPSPRVRGQCSRHVCHRRRGGGARLIEAAAPPGAAPRSRPRRPYSQNAMRGTPMIVVLFVVVSTAN